MNRILLFMIALMVLVGGCSSPADPEASGAQDFPNSLTAAVSLFERMSGKFSDFNHIENVKRGVPTQSDLSGAQTFGGAPLQKLYLAKSTSIAATDIDTAWWDLSDSSSGTVRHYRYLTGEHFTQRDTLWVLYTPHVYDTIDSNEIVLKQIQYLLWPYLGISIHYSSVNADSNCCFESRQTRYQVAAGAGQVNTVTLYERPGPDSSIMQWGDNLVDSLRVLESIDSDTLRYNFVTDADTDGVIWVYGVAGSFLADIHSVYFSDSTQPSLVRGELTARMVLDPYDLENSFPLRFTGYYRYDDDRTAATVLYGLTGDSLITPSDSVALDLAWFFPQPDTVESLFVSFIAKLDSTPLQPDADNYWSRFSGRLVTRSGSIASAHCSFIPTYPVHQQDTVFNGTFSLSATLVSAETIQLEGTLTDGALEGVFTDETTRQYKVTVTKQGKMHVYE